ncbi:MAG: GNAT family N-acetyltransferase [Drouetiella hepatica Uher 2000/2452]|jgi:ribosomal protein S18 acetylase RimI-like enzyme|uniref:GNAT family N-acetyltransferase n=1 Tax=Drouetiella hepatica Uher 2000/2452 TaxID=904376 RepID=A0A951QDG9_9CYAN|nr:GNAT family N-acetyltransferase [Drouetiella hepatica Uher 2000/2452]
MSTLPTDAFSKDAFSKDVLTKNGLSEALSSLEGVDYSAIDLSLLVRTVRKQDLGSLADILTSSFHSQNGSMGWLYPLLRAGIYEDLRTRSQTRTKHYACLVAARRMSSSELDQEAQARRSLQLNPSLHPAFTSTPAFAPTVLSVGSDRPIGTIEISSKNPPPWQSPHTRYLYLSNLAVHSNYRRQGAAQQLLQTCDRVALGWGFQDLYLHVLESNHAARRLYLRSGYRVLRAEASLSSWMLGRPRQLFMHKSLSTNSAS